MYGLTLLAIRVLGLALDAYARRERLSSPPGAGEAQQDEPLELLPVLGGYLVAILIGLVAPRVAVALYFAVALYMILFEALPRHRVPCPSGPARERPTPGLIR